MKVVAQYVAVLLVLAVAMPGVVGFGQLSLFRSYCPKYTAYGSVIPGMLACD
jgi:hypothetical protein